METLKKFVKYYAPYKGVFFLDLLCAAIISFVDLAFPQILRSLTKTLFLKDAAVILQALLPIGAGLLLMYAIQALCKYYVTCQGHMMGARMERDMRQELFEHYEKLSFSYYNQHNSGQMMSKLVSDQDCRSLYLLIFYQLETGSAASVSGCADADLFPASESPYAGNVHG